MPSLRIGAHRGAMVYAPENTLAAFDKAIEQQAYRIEFDLRRSRDGHIVVIHDDTVDRTTNGTGKVRHMDLAQLKALRSQGEEIPTFAETIACMRGRARLLIELKDEDIAEQVVRQIEAENVADQCTISSFHEPSLIQTHQLNPTLELAYFLVEPKPFDAAQIVADLNARLLIVWPRAAAPEYLSAAKAQGMQIRCGFRDNLSYEEIYQTFKELAAMGVEEFSCGRPDWIGQMIATYRQEAE